MVKSILIAGLALVCCAAFVGCGTGQKTGTKKSKKTSSNEDSATSASSNNQGTTPVQTAQQDCIGQANQQQQQYVIPQQAYNQPVNNDAAVIGGVIGVAGGLLSGNPLSAIGGLAPLIMNQNQQPVYQQPYQNGQPYQQQNYNSVNNNPNC